MREVEFFRVVIEPKENKIKDEKFEKVLD